jgi:hypothetical protein
MLGGFFKRVRPQPARDSYSREALGGRLSFLLVLFAIPYLPILGVLRIAYRISGRVDHEIL